MKTKLSFLGTMVLLVGGTHGAEIKASVTATQQCAEYTGVAIVRAVRGAGSYTIPGASHENVLRVGTILPEGAIIQTKAGAIADLALAQNGLVVRLTPKTKLSLEKLRYVTNGKDTIRTHTVLAVPTGKILATDRSEMRLPLTRSSHRSHLALGLKSELAARSIDVVALFAAKCGSDSFSVERAEKLVLALF